MAFSQDELRALGLLLREELESQILPFRNDVDKRFAEVATQIDGLYQRDEKRGRNTCLSGNRFDVSKPGSLSRC